MLTFIWVSFLAGISISRDVMQSSKTCTNYIGYLAYNVILIKITIEPRSGRRDLLAIKSKVRYLQRKKDSAVVNNYRKFDENIFTHNKDMSV